jgi:hypothetical protein
MYLDEFVTVEVVFSLAEKIGTAYLSATSMSQAIEMRTPVQEKSPEMKAEGSLRMPNQRGLKVCSLLTVFPSRSGFKRRHPAQ